MSRSPVPRVLSIAGSDSGGGAGIQADLKAFAACGVHGMTAITAVTAQNTVGVTAIHQVPPEVIIAQVTAVLDDIGIDAVKVGMLGTLDTIEAVRCALERLPRNVPVVLDPVMVAESGAVLLEPDARTALVERLLQWATVITPNLPEAREIAAGLLDGSQHEEGVDEPGEVESLARQIHARTGAVVVLTGGHRGVAEDVFCDGPDVVAIPGERFPDGASHGSGCTHSSVLAARLALGDDPLSAAQYARTLAGTAIARGLRGIGHGAGPVNVLDIGISAPPAQH